ncbi:MAG: hypothetical protein P4M07_00955 [Xanthobacteraceae bacterium]|nr:hypothetical protein [Xanthobacteraceae bacterium]
MISLGHLRKGLAFAALLIFPATLSGCITSRDVLLTAAATPVVAGRYEVQYLVDGRWTAFGAGSLALKNGKYAWVEDLEAASLLKQPPGGLPFALADMGNNVFIIVVATNDLGNPMWVGKYMYGVARRAGRTLLYDFPSCEDLLASQGIPDTQIEKAGADECLYSSRASLTRALIAYAKREAPWKRLAPSRG